MQENFEYLQKLRHQNLKRQKKDFHTELITNEDFLEKI